MTENVSNYLRMLEIEYRLRSHAEQEIEDREIRLKAIAMLKDLPIRARREIGIRLGTLGMNDVTEIMVVRRLVVCRIVYAWLNIRQFANLLAYFLVEIDQKRIFPFKERADVVCVILKKGTLAIGTLQSVPMHPSPLVVVADAQVFHELCIVVLHRDGKGLRTIGSGNHAAVAKGLLLVRVALLYQATVEAIEFLIPLHWSEIGSL